MSKKSPKNRRKDGTFHQSGSTPPGMSSKCFVCDENIQGTSVHLLMGRTTFSNCTFPSKLGELVGDDFMVVVCVEDKICRRCANLINHLDKLETDLKVVRKTLTGYLSSKYNINHRDLFSKFDTRAVHEKAKNGGAFAESVVKTSPKVYRCELCDFRTTEKKKVGVHAEECKKLPHACSLCPKRFPTIQDHARHAVMVHSLTRSCQICCSLFVDEQAVLNHLKSHPHCSLCDATFADEADVEEHTRKEHQVTVGDAARTAVVERKPDIAEACLLELVKDDDVKPSSLPEGDSTEIEFHSCKICALTFLKASLYNEHMKMHRNVNAEEETSECLNGTSLAVPLTKNSARHDCRINDDLEDLFEKLHAETETDPTNKLHKTVPDPPLNCIVEQVDEANGQSSGLFSLTSQNEIKSNSQLTEQVKNQVSDVIDDNYSEGKLKGLNCNAKRALKEKKKEQCCVCSKIFLSKIKLECHLDSHLKGGFCKCSVCGQSVSSQAALLEHCQNHLPKKKNVAKCRFCCLTFTTKRSCELHEESHTDVFVFACPNCDRRFTTEEELSEHGARLHRTDPHCRFCGKEIDNLQALRSHENRHTTLPENFECNVCHRVFKTKTGLRHHAAVHTGQFKYCCDFCGRGFMSRVMLEEHRRRHTKEERYVCDVCGRKFSFQSTYWIHRKWHDNPYPYKCNFCGRLFRHTSLLAVHKRKHTGERPYKCPHCPFTFAVGNTLKRHVILHTGAYPFKCEPCNRGFTTKDKFSLHQAKVHADYELINRKSQKKELKMVVHESTENVTQVDTINTWELIDGVALDQVLSGNVGTETEAVVDATTLPGTGTRVVEIVMDECYQPVATVTLAGVTDSETAISEIWYQ